MDILHSYLLLQTKMNGKTSINFKSFKINNDFIMILNKKMERWYATDLLSNEFVLFVIYTAIFKESWSLEGSWHQNKSLWQRMESI